MLHKRELRGGCVRCTELVACVPTVLVADCALETVILTWYTDLLANLFLNLKIYFHVPLLSGLDETSCFFVDEDGEQVEHGYYFDEIGFLADSQIYISFGGGDFPVDISRRKVIVLDDFAAYI